MDEAFEEFPDPNAVTFSKVVFRFVHLLDDLFDRDKDRSADDVALTFFALVDQVASNPFFQAHKASLMPVLYSSAKAWSASERLRKSPAVQDNVAAEVLKSEYQNLFFHVALLAGGVEFAHHWETKHRSYNFG